jgi:antitoxin YefM
MTVFCHKGTFMQAVNYTAARNNLKTIIDNVCDNNEEVIVTTKNDKSVVIISLDEYNQTHAQLKRDVKKAIAEIEKGDFMDIDEAFEQAKKAYRA